MSTDTDLILQAIADGATNRSAIVEHTGFEAKLVSNRLYVLKAKGAITLVDGEYAIADGEPPKARVRTVAAREQEEAGDAPAPAKRGRKRKAVKASPPPAAIAANGRTHEFAVAESGAILFKIVSGPKAGELGEIGCADALALFRLMGQVEFIAENA